MATFFRWAGALVLVILLVFGVLLLADPVQAQTTQCAPIEQMLESLASQYGEEMVSTGLGPNGIRMMVFAHPDGDTWTFLAIIPDGRACFVASGTDFRSVPPTPAGSET